MRNTKAYRSLPFNPNLRDRAKELRKAGNLCEVLLWQQLHKKKFRGYDFDRQKIIGNYIVDFYCLDCNVVIEIDGSSHDYKAEYDEERDKYLESLGLVVIHVRAKDVLGNLGGVMEMLYEHPALMNHPGVSRALPEKGNKQEGQNARLQCANHIQPRQNQAPYVSPQERPLQRTQ